MLPPLTLHTAMKGGLFLLLFLLVAKSPVVSKAQHQVPQALAPRIINATDPSKHLFNLLLRHQNTSPLNHQSKHPGLALATADFASFLNSDFNYFKDGEGGDDDPVWLVISLARHLEGGLPYVTPQDIECLTNPSYLESCCPSPSLRPPSLPSRFLSEAFDVHTKLAVFLDEVGFHDLSRLHLQRAEAICGVETGVAFRLGFMTRPVEPSMGSMRSHRAELLASISKTFSSPLPSSPESPVDMEWTSTPPQMMIGYQFMNDDEPLSMIAEGMKNNYPHLVNDGVEFIPPENPDHGSPIELAIVSSFLYSHSVGRLLVGLIEELPKSKFNVRCISLSPPSPSDDPIVSRFSEACTTYTALDAGTDLATLKSTVRNFHPHILLYPELGMSPLPLLLSYSRLAPLQLCFWGHPIPQHTDIDFYVSSESFGPWGPTQPVLLDGLNVLFDPPPPLSDDHGHEPPSVLSLVPPNSIIHLAPHTLMKHHPRFTSALLSIASHDRNYVILTHSTSQLRTALNLPQSLLDHPRVLITPTLPRHQFYALLSSSSTFLDPFPFGGGVTALEAILHGLPVVTCPSCQGVVTLASGKSSREIGTAFCDAGRVGR